MKNKVSAYSFLTASLALLVPAPGRFAYGILLLLLMNILMLAGTLFKRLVNVLKVDELLPILLAVFLITLSILYKQILAIFSPVLALTLSFVIYMPAVSSFVIGNLYSQSAKEGELNIKENMKHSFHFSLYALLVFLFRDIFGYGTISLPSASGLIGIPVMPIKEGGFYAGIFWASIPGAVVITALSIAVYSYVSSKFEMVKKEEEINGNS